MHICDGIGWTPWAVLPGGKAGGPSGSRLWGTPPGHFKLPTTLEEEQADLAPIYETATDLGMPVMLSNEWGVSEGRLAGILSSFPLPVSGGGLLTSGLSVTQFSSLESSCRRK